ncbi:MAG: phosphate acyltransferase [marine bacterium B5-7]|nr:MAG: phosphate acyltransferase [marine bacterium B5-7]
MDVTIALDAMGGDRGASVVVPAAIKQIQKHPELKLILVGDEGVLSKRLARHKMADNPRLIIQHASELVEMDESPSTALRNKKDSSMRVAINLVKEERAQACVSAGNTGALMATARFVLKTLPGIDRPAIVSRIPNMKRGHVRVLDLGANVDSTAEHLFQFALMGSLIANEVDLIHQPKVGLLNIGVEEIKGNEQVKATAELLNESHAVNYIGYIEADSIFHGDVDVVVCDGFVGNVALKSMEGAAHMIANVLKKSFTRNLYSKLAALIATPVLKYVKGKIDPAAYNGASFIGLRGIVVKSHGGTTVEGFESAIEEALHQVEHNVPAHIHDRVEAVMQKINIPN